MITFKIYSIDVLHRLQFMKNNRENCIAGKIFVHSMNIILWFILFCAVFAVVFVPAEPVRKFYGILCIMGLFADFLLMSFAEPPVLDNPFKKAPQSVFQVQKAVKEIIKEPIIDTEASFSKAMAAGKDNSSKINTSVFD